MEEQKKILSFFFSLAHSSRGLHNQVLRKVGAAVLYQVFKAMAIERPISGLVLRNAYHCILIPFPKDHRDVSTGKLGEKTVPTPTIQEEEYKAITLSSWKKKPQTNNPTKTFLATTLGSGQSHSTPNWAAVGGQSPKSWSFASINSSQLLL